MTEATRTCAICVEPAVSGAMEPMGKGGAMVFVCSGCSTNKPTQRLGTERGYETRDRAPTYRDARRIATALIPQLEEMTKAARHIPISPRALAHGYRMVRVARFDPLVDPSRRRREPCLVPDRDAFVPKDPPPAVRAQTAPPVHVDDDYTGRLEGPELAAARAKRPTNERVGHLEGKHDALVKTVEHLGDKHQELAVVVANQDGKLDAILAHSEESAKERDRRRAHEAQQAEAERRWRAAGKVAAAVLGAIATAVMAYLGFR